MRGYYTQTRDEWHDEFFETKEPFTKREAMLWLRQAAAFEPTPFFYRGKEYTTQRGQYAGTILGLAEQWGWKSRNKVRKFLNDLEGLGYIERTEKGQRKDSQEDTEKDTNFLLITICNYDIFSKSEEEQRTPVETEERTEKGQRKDSPNHIKINNKINIPPIYPPINNSETTESPTPSPTRKRKVNKLHRLPEGWIMPVGWHNYPKERWGWDDRRCSDEAEKFTSHYSELRDLRCEEPNWNSRWRTWCIKAQEWSPFVQTAEAAVITPMKIKYFQPEPFVRVEETPEEAAEREKIMAEMRIVN